MRAEHELRSRRAQVIDLEAMLMAIERAFKYRPNDEDSRWFRNSQSDDLSKVVVLDPTAGGGSIPFEAVRLGIATFGKRLNPVAALIE